MEAMRYLWLWMAILGVSVAQAGTIHQTTEGWCSPAVGHTGGHVIITCQGVDPKALQRLNELLDQKDLELQDKIREAEEWTRKYHDLSQRLAATSLNSVPAQEAKALLAEGRLEAAGKMLFTEAYSMAQHHREYKNYAQAIAHYEQALQINPTHFGAYYNIAVSYQHMGQVEQALLAFEQALELSPRNASTHYNMATLYQQKGDPTKAMVHYKQVIELAPEDSDISQRARKNLKVLGE
jgi:tetratricopeptide (TPR) repeat protein